MNFPATIRHATLCDAQQISQLIQSVAHFCTFHPSGEDAEGFLMSITEASISGYIVNPDFIYIVAFIDSKLVGAAALRNGNHLYHLFVDANLHRCGIGIQLWKYLKTLAVSSTQAEIFTVNASLMAVPFYERLGFKPQSLPIAEKGVVFVPMKLKLQA